MADSDQRKDLKGKAPMPSSSELPNLPEPQRKDLMRKAPMQSSSKLPKLPEPQCLKDLIDVDKCSKPFEKQITPYDEAHCTLGLHKNFVKNEWLPMLETDEDVKKGVPVIVYGPDASKGYAMYFVGGISEQYSLNRGWKKFANDYLKKPSDNFVSVWMFRRKITSELCLAVTWRPSAPNVKWFPVC